MIKKRIEKPARTAEPCEIEKQKNYIQKIKR